MMLKPAEPKARKIARPPTEAEKRLRYRDDSADAGLQFNVNLIKSVIKNVSSKLSNHPSHVGRGAPVYFAAVLEYMTAEILELSGNSARDNGRHTIMPQDIKNGIMNDEELGAMFQHVIKDSCRSDANSLFLNRSSTSTSDEAIASITRSTLSLKMTETEGIVNDILQIPEDVVQLLKDYCASIVAGLQKWNGRGVDPTHAIDKGLPEMPRAEGYSFESFNAAKQLSAPADANAADGDDSDDDAPMVSPLVGKDPTDFMIHLLHGLRSADLVDSSDPWEFVELALTRAISEITKAASQIHAYLHPSPSPSPTMAAGIDAQSTTLAIAMLTRSGEGRLVSDVASIEQAMSRLALENAAGKENGDDDEDEGMNAGNASEGGSRGSVIGRRLMVDMSTTLGGPKVFVTESGDRDSVLCLDRVVREIAQDFKTDLRFAKLAISMIRAAIDSILRLLLDTAKQLVESKGGGSASISQDDISLAWLITTGRNPPVSSSGFGGKTVDEIKALKRAHVEELVEDAEARLAPKPTEKKVQLSGAGNGSGLGGRGLGMGGAKRHRKVLRDNLPTLYICCLETTYEGLELVDKALSYLVHLIRCMLEDLIKNAVTFTEHARRKTVFEEDVYRGIVMTQGSVNPLRLLFRQAVLHAVNCAEAPDSMELEAPRPAVSILTLLARVGLMEHYVDIMQHASMPLAEATKIVGAAREDRKLLIAAFATLGEPAFADTAQPVARKPTQIVASALAPIKPASARDLPVDPMCWLPLDKSRRQSFARPTDEIDAALLAPFLELYDVYRDTRLFGYPPNLQQNATLERSMIMTNRRDVTSKSACIVSLTEFRKQWATLSQGVFEGADLSNCFIAGGSVLGCLMPHLHADSLGGFGSSDIDVFVYGLDEPSARRRLVEVLNHVIRRRIEIARSQRSHDGQLPSDSELENVVVHSKHAVTLVGFGGFRPVQFVLRIYRSPSEILLGFDVDCCCVGMAQAIRGDTNLTVFASPRCWRALVTRCNAIDTTRRSPSYESRLEKYAQRGFGIYLSPDFDVSQIDPSKVINRYNYAQPRGFEALLLKDLQQPQSKLKVKLVRPPQWLTFGSGLQLKNYVVSDYCMGLRWFDYTTISPENVTSLFQDKDGNPVTAVGIKAGREEEAVWFLRIKSDQDIENNLGDLAWLTTNPGQQGTLLTGSFHPETGGDWVRTAEWSNAVEAPAAAHLSRHSISSLLLGRCTGHIRRRGDLRRRDSLFAFASAHPISLGCDVYDAVNALESNIYKVLKQVHPNITISQPALGAIKSVLVYLIKGLVAQMLRLMSNRRLDMGKKTLSSREVQTAVRLLLKGELAKHAVSEGTKAVTKYFCNW